MCALALSDLLADDIIRVTEDIKFCFRYLAYHSYRKPGARERLTVHKAVRQSEHTSELADFVLEKSRQRLDNALKAEILRKSADVVMAFYNSRFIHSRLNYIGINRSLRKKVRMTAFLCLVFKRAGKFRADYLSLLLGICNSAEFFYKTLSCVNINEIKLTTFKRRTNLVRFVLSHKAVVYINADKLTGDRFRKKSRAN